MPEKDDPNLTLSILGETLHGNTAALAKLGGGIGLAIQAIHSLAQPLSQVNRTLTSVGMQQMAAATNIGSNLRLHGLSLKESTDAINAAANTGMLAALATRKSTDRLGSTLLATANTSKLSAEGIEDSVGRLSGSTKNLLSIHKGLGKDIQKLGKGIAHNVFALGISSDGAKDIARTFLDVGKTYGINSDVLADAMHSLSKSIKSAAVLWGPKFSESMQKFGSLLGGMVGPGAAEMVNPMLQKMFGGTMESMITMAKLGLGGMDLKGAGVSDIASAFETALDRVNQLRPTTGGIGGAAQLEAISKAFGIDASFFMIYDALTRNGETVEQALASLERQEENALAINDMMVALNDIAREAAVILMPAIQVIGTVFKLFNRYLPFTSIIGGLLGTWFSAWMLSHIFSKKMLLGIFNGIKLAWSILSKVAGPWIAGITLLVSALMMFTSLFSKKDESENAQRTADNTQILADDVNKKTFDAQQVIGERMSTLIDITQVFAANSLEVNERTAEATETANDISGELPNAVQGMMEEGIPPLFPPPTVPPNTPPYR